MELINKLVEDFKEITYDIVGYLIPGFLILYIVTLPISSNHISSPLYSIYDILFDNSQSFFSLELFKIESFPQILISIIIVYLLGHIPIHVYNYILNTLNFVTDILNIIKRKYNNINLIKHLKEKINTFRIYKRFKELIKKNFLKNHENYVDDLYKNLIPILKSKSNFPNDLLKCKNSNDIDGTILSHFTSTISRFESHNNLIQKYICKSNFYKSVFCIFFFILIDSFISSLVWISYNTKKFNSSISIFFVVINLTILITTISFYSQHKRHTQLKNKEMLLFLYEYYCTSNKNNSN